MRRLALLLALLVPALASAQGPPREPRYGQARVDRSHPLAPDALYLINEYAGLTAFDSVGLYHGTLTNMDPATDWVPTQRGIALDFDGGNDHIVYVGSVIDDSYPVTLTAWVRSTSATVNQTVVAVSDASGQDYFAIRLMGATGGDPVRATANLVHTDGDALALNTWQHVAAVFASTTDVRVYQDGVQTGTGTGGVAPAGLDRNSIWALYYNSTPHLHFMVGQVAEASIYSRALSSAEILSLYQDRFQMLETAQMVAWKSILGAPPSIFPWWTWPDINQVPFLEVNP